MLISLINAKEKFEIEEMVYIDTNRLIQIKENLKLTTSPFVLNMSESPLTF